MKQILITNDDGFESPGLRALAKALRDLGHLIIVAPTTEKSACGHSLTLTRPLRFIEIDDNFYKLDDGTPSDCIYLALHALYEEGAKPDLVISGINKGANMGEDITYSGTASGAMEAVLQGIPAIAISQVCKDKCQGMEEFEFDLAREVACDLAQRILNGRFPVGHRRFLNVNVPPLSPQECKGYKITKAGYRLYGNDAHLHRNPRGEEYYWLGLHPLRWEPSIDHMCDFEAIRQGFVSITPIKLDLTAYEELEELRRWL